MYIQYYEDNGVVIGAMLLCLQDGQILPRKELINISKEVSLLDPEKGAKMCFNSRLIDEEITFFTFNNIYKEKKGGYVLKDRKLAERYCGSYCDENLKIAVNKVINQIAIANTPTKQEEKEL